MNLNNSNILQHIHHYTYLKEDLLGKGATGTVYQGVHQHTLQKVAIKVIEMKTINNEVTRYLLDCEKQALTSINNPNVLRAYDIIQSPSLAFVVTCLCDGGTLKQRIRHKGKLPEKEALEIFIKILMGYSAIKQKGFIHRDLKSSNIMFRGNEPVIIDFGYCQKVTGPKPKVFYNVGSPSYMSPEAYYKTLYSEKSDIWALGIILYEMLEGRTIDHGMPINRYFNSIIKNGYNLYSQISEGTKAILKGILQIQPERRSSTVELLKMVQQTIKSVGNSQGISQPGPIYLHGQDPKARISLKDHHQVQKQIKTQQGISLGNNDEKANLQPSSKKKPMQILRNSILLGSQYAKGTESIIRNEGSLDKMNPKDSVNISAFEMGKDLRPSRSSYLPHRDSEASQASPKSKQIKSPFEQSFFNDSIIMGQEPNFPSEPKILRNGCLANSYHSHNPIDPEKNVRESTNIQGKKNNLIQSVHWGYHQPSFFEQEKKQKEVAHSFIFPNQPIATPSPATQHTLNTQREWNRQTFHPKMQDLYQSAEYRSQPNYDRVKKARMTIGMAPQMRPKKVVKDPVFLKKLAGMPEPFFKKAYPIQSQGSKKITFSAGVTPAVQRQVPVRQQIPPGYPVNTIKFSPKTQGPPAAPFFRSIQPQRQLVFPPRVINHHFI